MMPAVTHFSATFSQKNANAESLKTPVHTICFTESAPFTFTGKERDAETGYGYFGARYMDFDLLSSFLSVDRFSYKYPHTTPYAYCLWNPIKLIDPTGDTIFNKYEQYKDIAQSIDNLTKLRSETNFLSKERRSINGKIRYLKKQNDNYQRVKGALDAFKEANPNEYNRLDQLSFNGNAINIIVGVSDCLLSEKGSAGETEILHNPNDQTITSPIKITLFGQAFAGHYSGLRTLANEFGDAIFGVECPEIQVIGFLNMEKGRQNYWGEASSKFSSDYELYITEPKHNKKPNPHSLKYSN